jgi:hypothetical protein
MDTPLVLFPSRARLPSLSKQALHTPFEHKRRFAGGFAEAKCGACPRNKVTPFLCSVICCLLTIYHSIIFLRTLLFFALGFSGFR